MTVRPATLPLLALLLVGSACHASPDAAHDLATRLAAATPLTTPAPSALPALTVHRHPSCGCCGKWMEHMRGAGFSVTVNEVDDVAAMKDALGMPLEHASCHTAQVDGYLVEGHVPASDVQRLLRERPDAVGLVLPGMPIGSPGMESSTGRNAPYTVMLLHRDGSTSDWSHHP